MSKNTLIKNSELLLSRLAFLSEQELAELIILHNDKYFIDNAPDITDEAFDKLVEVLKFKNPHAPVLSLIGGHHAFGEQVVHLRPMLSLDKCYDDEAFSKWAEKIHGDMVAMPKIDGAASSLIYDKTGQLILAATRGDGRIGEDITKNVRVISDVPQKLDETVLAEVLAAPDFLEVRGEMFLPLSRFNERYAQEFANARNLAAGALKLKESERSKSYGLKFLPYDLRGSKAQSETEKFIFLQKLGFMPMSWRYAKDIEEARQVFRLLHDERLGFDYETDGVVFRANQLTDQQRLGETAHHPRYALAYKFQTETAQTELVSVEWSISRSGAITPVAIVKPVFLSGATISRASLHNLGIFLKLGLCEESLLEINRRGGVIPHVERVLSTKGQALTPPSRCPSCTHTVVVEGDFLLCSAKNKCAGVVVSSLIHFCQVIGLEGFGEKLISKLFEQGLVQSFSDVFRLNLGKLSSIERMGEVLANKLIKEINNNKVIELATFLKSLGIDEIGTHVAEILATNFHTLSSIRALNIEDLIKLHGIGDRIAVALVQGLQDQKEEIDELLKEVHIRDYEGIAHDGDESNAIFGKSVVFTGKMAHLERKSAQDLVKKLGGTAPGAISAKTDFLVVGDDGSPLLGQGVKSTKQKEAEKLINAGSSLKIISESDFLEMINHN